MLLIIWNVTRHGNRKYKVLELIPSWEKCRGKIKEAPGWVCRMTEGGVSGWRSELLLGMGRASIRVTWEEESCSNRAAPGRPSCSNLPIRGKLLEQREGLGTAHFYPESPGPVQNKRRFQVYCVEGNNLHPLAQRFPSLCSVHREYSCIHWWIGKKKVPNECLNIYMGKRNIFKWKGNFELLVLVISYPCIL